MKNEAIVMAMLLGMSGMIGYAKPNPALKLLIEKETKADKELKTKPEIIPPSIEARIEKRDLGNEPHDSCGGGICQTND